MNVKVPGWVLLLLSAITSFGTASMTALLSMVYVLGDKPIPPTGWLVIGGSGLLVSFKDVRSMLSLPPVDVQRPAVSPDVVNGVLTEGEKK